MDQRLEDLKRKKLLRKNQNLNLNLKRKNSMPKKFKAHYMYKGKSAIMAKTYAKHLELKKKRLWTYKT